MPVLTNFLPVKELEKWEVTKTKKYTNQLNKFRKVVNLMAETFDIQIPEKSDMGAKILKREAEVFNEFWHEVGVIPTCFNCSCLGENEEYSSLSELSKYPIVKISELKKMAEALGFAILPIEYINTKEIYKMYREEDKDYAEEINEAYLRFLEATNYSPDWCLQQIYMLAPISFYNPWEEVKCEYVVPKYFSKELQYLSTILGMVIPAQRNLYKMITSTEKKIESLQKEMQENFRNIEKAITECHRRIDWVENLIGGLNTKVRNDESIMMLNLHYMQIQITQLECTLYCNLDPIIFSVDDEIDISDSDYDDEKAHIGLCFGVDMPIEFFSEKGLSLINDERMDAVTHILKI